MINQALLLLWTFAFSSARAQLSDGVFGAGPWNASYAQESNRNPNATKSVPFQLGAQNYTFQVNVAELQPAGSIAKDAENPRVAASFYNMLWDGDYSLNDTLRNAFSFGQNAVPKLCVTVANGASTLSATNGYRDEDDGDCSHALGNQCMKDLANVTSTQLSGSCTGAWMPKSCISRLGTGGLLSHNLVGRLSTNDTTDPLFQESPLGFGWYQSPIHSAGNSSYYQREADRLHAVFFHGNNGEIIPICSRVNTTRLKKDSNAITGGASSFKRSSHFPVLLALTVVVFML
ncbi:hypothetical protein D6D01_08733 [Aureobasidium pullulans]|uniref:Uncharacterized protein n=1 Tax=Aureobasidium pullulans TaxID=5580 RepID=A0A4S9K9Q5_AURPU|nr:hypothetical protein D6D01_08733 [Aureobasidium pullulans]